MQERHNTSFDSPDFKAHLYLSDEKQQRRRWEHVFILKLTQALSEKDASWKRSEHPRETVAHHETSTTQQLTFNFALRDLFTTLADWWSTETEHTSNLNKAINHPAYQQIIGMGKVAPTLIVSLILRELEERPDHWFAALHEITGVDPVGPDDSFDEAIDAWQEWGKQQYSR